MPSWFTKKNIAAAIVSWTEWLIGRPHTAHSWRFMKNIGITGTSTALVGGLGMLTTVLLGRLLGPTEFGQYNLAISLAQFIVIFLTCGLHTALTHAVPRSTDIPTTIRSVLPLFLGTVSGGVLVYLFMLPALMSLLHISEVIGRLSLVLAGVYAGRYLADALLRGQRLFRQSAWLDVSSAVLGFGLCLLLLERGWRMGVVFLSIPITIATIYALSGLWQSRALFGWQITNQSWSLLRYGFWSVVVGITQLILLQIDRIFINYYSGPAALGIFSGYISGALLVTAFVFTITNYVLLPESSAMTDIAPVLRILQKRRWYLILGMSGIACLTATVFMRVLGRAYPWHWPWILLVSLYAGVYFYANVLITIAFSRGQLVVQKLWYVTSLAVGLYGLSLYILVHYLGLTGFFMALVVVYIFLIIVVTRLLRYNTRMSYDPSL